MERHAMTIDGRGATAEAHFPVVNPALPQELVGEAPECAPAQLDDAMRTAQRAFPAWAADADARHERLRAAAAALRRAADELAPLLTREQGKPLRDARREVLISADRFDYFAGLALTPKTVQDDDAALVKVVRRPMGVVAAITPWNSPLVTAVNKVAPALAAGNAVVLKPSPYTPLATLAMGALLAEVLPAGILNVVSGRDPLGAQMVAHPVPRKIALTGSVPTGKRVAAEAAADLKRVTLELGGNDAAIVLDDLDVERAAEGLFWGAFANCGQVCVAIKRLYVPRSRYDEVVAALAAKAASVRVGDGMEPETEIGPLNNEPQLARVRELVADALAHGARAAAGGAPLDGDGWFHAPTILADASDGMRIVDEEQFGPALPVVAYDALDDAIARANGTMFGLGGSVWGEDLGRARAVAAQLQCGTAWINAHRVLQPHQPFPAVKWSGVGVHGGILGLEECTEIQTVYERR
jgi:acyl-CoA reductase-like NAD-dependent aldehyde dehydrogenase